jgi:hypothetical protein
MIDRRTFGARAIALLAACAFSRPAAAAAAALLEREKLEAKAAILALEGEALPNSVRVTSGSVVWRFTADGPLAAGDLVSLSRFGGVVLCETFSEIDWALGLALESAKKGEQVAVRIWGC